MSLAITPSASPANVVGRREFLRASRRIRLNYRHAFHAGNFADLVKHSVLLRLLAELTTNGGPLTIIDTHAGRGLYDLGGQEARKSGEAKAGIVRLMNANDAPKAFAPLLRAVGRLNGEGDLRRYPGSPWLIANTLRLQDRYVACELLREEHDALVGVLEGRRNIRTLCMDGYAAALTETPASGRVLVLIDPPFESADDYARVVEAVACLRRRNREAQALIWLPIKDLETLDSFLRDLEDAAPGPMVIGEVRIRPLSNPMRMNGCALAQVGGPDIERDLAAICGWVAQALGAGGASRVYRLATH